MSDAISKFNEDILKESELRSKERALKEHRVQTEFDQFERNRIELEKIKNVKISEIDDADTERLVKEHEDYLRAAKSRKYFVANVPEVNDSVPFFRKNLIFIGAVTGEGKSTCCANLALATLSQGGKVLLITNEELAGDVYGRVTALMKGLNYTNHASIPEADIPIYSAMLPKLKQRMTVIDQSYAGIDGFTTCIEGLETILSKLIEDDVKYDAILIDYYENFGYSKSRPSSPSWEVLERVAKRLESFKNVYPAPIVIFGQLKPIKDKDSVHIKERTQGRKIIIDKATCAIELRADRANHRTEWVVHKNRFGASGNTGFFTGFIRGRYVAYTDEFKRKIQEKKVQLLTNTTKGDEDGSKD